MDTLGKITLEDFKEFKNEITKHFLGCILTDIEIKVDEVNIYSFIWQKYKFQDNKIFIYEEDELISILENKEDIKKFLNELNEDSRDSLVIF